MRFAIATLAASAFALGLFGAPIPKVKEKVKDEVAFVGVWQVEKFDFGPDVPVPPLDFTRMQFTFEAEGRLAMTIGDLPSKESTYKIDAVPKVKTIDLTENKQVVLGIYKLDGDALQLCFGEGTNIPRPTEFKAGDGKIVVTLKRAKKEK